MAASVVQNGSTHEALEFSSSDLMGHTDRSAQHIEQQSDKEGLRSVFETRNANAGHRYHSNVVEGNGSAHFGNVYTQTVNYYVTPSGNRSFQTCAVATPLLLDQAELTGQKRKHVEDANAFEPRKLQKESLDTALSKLQKLSLYMETPMQDLPARKITRRIATVIDALKSSGFARSARQHTEFQWSDLRERLLLGRRLRINSTPPVVNCGNFAVVQRRRDVLRYARWEITLTTTETSVPDEEGHETTQSMSVLRLEPCCNHTGSPLVAFFGCQTDLLRTNMIHPVVLAYRTVPGDSKVFSVIEEDDLECLLKLMATQKVTVRDCDEKGRSLLSVRTQQRWIS